MTGKKISVIIPAYNVEKYIRRCLDSLVNQTYENMEIIVVDDGSIDRTGDIVQEYVEKYPEKVILVTKRNGGQAEARNLGLSKATGEYIGFVDSDDFVSTKMYELLYCEAEEQGCDLVTCGYYGCDDVTGEITVYQTGYKGEFNQSIYENPLILQVNSPYPWNKLYARELLERSGFQFRKGIIFEDLCAIFPLFMDAKKVGRVHEKLYYYIKNRKGGTISTFNEKHGQIIDALEIMNEAYKERGMFDTFYNTLLFFNIRHIYARFDEMENYENEDFCNEFTERANNLLDTYFPGWKESEEFAKLRTGEAVENENTDEVQSTEKAESVLAKKNSPKKKGKRRAEVFEGLLAERTVEKNTVLIECYHGNDVRGAGYYIGGKLAEEGGFRVLISAADEGKIKQFSERYRENWEFVDMTSEKYLEVLATAEYVINNRAFPGFYRKNKGQKFIFTDLLPSFIGQGKDVVYGTKNMQGIQFSLAQADAILYPEELQDTFLPLLEEYNMAEICRDKAVYVPIKDVFYNDRTSGGIKIAYMPAVKAFPGLKDVKHYLFLSELRRKLLELDEKIEDGRKLCVCYPRIVRRRLQANDWKHIEFFAEETEPYEVLASCQGAVGEAGEELYVMKALGRPVARMSEDAPDMVWSCGCGVSEDGFDHVSDVGQMVTWINRVSDEADKINSTKPKEFLCGEFLRSLKPKKNQKSGRKVMYIPAFDLREDFQRFMQSQNISQSIFFVEKDNMNDNMAAWLREYGDELRYIVIIRSIVLRAGESRKIKYKLTTKDKLREKRDRERYL